MVHEFYLRALPLGPNWDGKSISRDDALVGVEEFLREEKEGGEMTHWILWNVHWWLPVLGAWCWCGVSVCYISTQVTRGYDV